MKLDNFKNYRLEDYYIVLKVKYVSVYIAEMQYSNELGGELRRKYLKATGFPC
jgi:hypothetical protein